MHLISKEMLFSDYCNKENVHFYGRMSQRKGRGGAWVLKRQIKKGAKRTGGQQILSKL